MLILILVIFAIIGIVIVLNKAIKALRAEDTKKATTWFAYAVGIIISMSLLTWLLSKFRKDDDDMKDKTTSKGNDTSPKIFKYYTLLSDYDFYHKQDNGKQTYPMGKVIYGYEAKYGNDFGRDNTKTYTLDFALIDFVMLQSVMTNPIVVYAGIPLSAVRLSTQVEIDNYKKNEPVI